MYTSINIVSVPSFSKKLGKEITTYHLDTLPVFLIPARRAEEPIDNLTNLGVSRSGFKIALNFNKSSITISLKIVFLAFLNYVINAILINVESIV